MFFLIYPFHPSPVPNEMCSGPRDEVQSAVHHVAMCNECDDFLIYPQVSFLCRTLAAKLEHAISLQWDILTMFFIAK